MKYIYFVEIKDIHLNVEKKIEVFLKSGRMEIASIRISDVEKNEYISLVKTNLMKKGI